MGHYSFHTFRSAHFCISKYTRISDILYINILSINTSTTPTAHATVVESDVKIYYNQLIITRKFKLERI